MQPEPLRLYKELDELGVPGVRAKFNRGEYTADAVPIVHAWLQVQSKPHWSVTLGFWVGVVAMVASCFAAYYAYLAYSQPQQSAASTPPPVKQHSM